MGKSVIGCEYLVAAPVASDVSGALPTYGTGFVVAAMASANENATIASGELWLNNTRKYYRSKFAGGTFTPTVDEMTDAAAVALLGCKMNGTKLVYNENDIQPYVGVAFFEELEDSDTGASSFRCTAYLKAKAKLSSKSVRTKDNSVTFQTRELPFELFSSADRDWKCEETFSTYAAAKAWCDTMMNVAAHYRVDVVVSGSGISADKDGTNYVAAGGSIVITVTGTPTSLFDNGAVISLTEGAYTISNIAANHEVIFVKTA